MVEDPCKTGKCISYPICLNKTDIICEMFDKYVNNYIDKNLMKVPLVSNMGAPKLSRKTAELLTRHMLTIFPNIERVTHRYKLCLNNIDCFDGYTSYNVNTFTKCTHVKGDSLWSIESI